MRYVYEINEKNEVRVWDNERPNENNAPFLFQPDWPNGTPWTDRAEAEAWVNLFIESFIDPESEYLAGSSPEEPRRLRLKPDAEDETKT